VAGGAWVAPTVLTLDAAHAVGTCPSGSIAFPWSNGGADGTTHVPLTNPLVGTSTTGGIDIRILAIGQSATGVVGTAADNFTTRNPTQNAAFPPTLNCGSAATTNYPRGTKTSFYSLLMNNTAANNCTTAGTAGRFVEVTFGFFNTGTLVAHPVRNLAFTLLDIDSANSYRDQVQIFINGNLLTPATVGAGQDITLATRVGGGASTVTVPGAAATFTAINGMSAAANTTDGNLALQFNPNNNVTSVRVRFTDILAGGPTSVQWVGIGDLTFCKV